MGLFDFLKKKRVKLTEKHCGQRGRQIRLMRSLWPIRVKLTTADICNISTMFQVQAIYREMSTLKTVLPPELRETLIKAYEAYLASEENDNYDEKTEEILEQCDNTFYENEEEINRILEEYAAKIELQK